MKITKEQIKEFLEGLSFAAVWLAWVILFIIFGGAAI